jgi:hypothetical protein
MFYFEYQYIKIIFKKYQFKKTGKNTLFDLKLIAQLQIL